MSEYLDVLTVSASVEPAGDFIYRAKRPWDAMIAEAGGDVLHVTHLTAGSLSEEDFRHPPDVLFVNQAFDALTLALARKVRASGKVVIVDINDYYSGMSPWFNAYEQWQKNRDNFDDLVETATALVTSSKRLAYLYRETTRKPVTWWPNGLVPAVQEPDGLGLRYAVGWGGSDSHLRDLAQASEVLRRLGEYRTLRVMCSSHLLRSLPSDINLIHTPPGDLDSYLQWVACRYAGLILAENNVFNWHRSDIKMLEYLQAGVIPIWPRIAPYADYLDYPDLRKYSYGDVSEIPDLIDRAYAAGLNFRQFDELLESRAEKNLAPAKLGWLERLIGPPGSGER